MASLYLISQSLQQTFDEIEENDGELTPELEEKLAIKEEELEKTLIDYKNYIDEVTHRITLADAEEKRIKAFKKSNNSKIERAKYQIVQAVNRFGYVNNKGKRIIDLPTVTFSIRDSVSTEVDQTRVDMLINYLNKALVDLVLTQGQYVTGVEKAEMILDKINELAQAYSVNNGVPFQAYTLDDLLLLNVSISVKATINDMLDDGMLSLYATNIHRFTMESDISKTEMKQSLSLVNEEGEPMHDITYAKLSENENLMIK